jgi:signal transduction histidine kinase
MRTQSQRRAHEERFEALAKRLEREHAARIRAEAANRKMNEFLANVCHELRTPLNALQLEIKLLQGRTASPEFLAGLQAMRRNADAQARLITDLLETGPEVSPRMRLRCDIVDLADVLEDAVACLAAEAKARSIDIRIELELNVRNCELRGDVGRLTQVFWNLLGNAVKFSPAGGQVLVTAARAGREVQVSVIDFGKGIEPRFIPMVFERFWQAASPTVPVKGLGLGLPIVKQIVELHGGSVSVESAGPGHGATFIVKLPTEGSGAIGEATAS